MAVLTEMVYVNMLFDDEEREERNDEAVTVMAILLLHKIKRVRVLGYVENVVSSMSGEEFARHFRLSAGTFDYILQIMHDVLLPKAPGGNLDAISPSPSKQLLIFLWYIANQDSMRELAILFGISESTVHKVIRNVSDSLCGKRKSFIHWPSQARRREIAGSFQEICGLDGIVGAIDGTHIRMMNMPGGNSDYINRKKFPSIQPQVTVDNMMLFTNTYVGWPGSAHDARVFRNSNIAHDAEQGRLFSDNEFIIGDSAYPLRPYLITVFRENRNLTRQQKVFNKRLSSCRQVVERAIGLMKGRFRRLREVYCNRIDWACKLITCACILHNICVLADDDVQVLVEEDEEVNQYHNIYNNAEPGIQLRNRLLNTI